MKNISYLSLIFMLWLAQGIGVAGGTKNLAKESNKLSVFQTPLQCVAFSPYVEGFSPDWGGAPPHELIDSLLDTLLRETPFRCISTYGVLNGLDYIFSSARARHIKVVATLWIDKDPTINSQSISTGIPILRDFEDTIIAVSCGSEIRTRHDYRFDNEVVRCLDALREAGIKQPLGTIDIWWEWCNRETPCHKTLFSDKVDWIGVNVFPWWENEFSPVYPCTSFAEAGAFHLARLEEVQKANPGKHIMLTEFGWPNGPGNSRPKNKHNGAQCGEAGAKQQLQVVNDTFAKLSAKNWSGALFEAFSENWKPDKEGGVGRYWGICSGKAPYGCVKGIVLPKKRAAIGNDRAKNPNGRAR